MKYDELDDIFEEDDFGDIPGLDEMLEAHGMNIETAANKCDEYISEFDTFVKSIGCTVKDKFHVCEKTAQLLENGDLPDDEIIWCYALLSSFSDILFKYEDDSDVRISSYFLLTDEAEMRMRSHREQTAARNRFRQIISHITYSVEAVGELDFRRLQKVVFDLGFKGDALENNLKMLTDVITHSPELFEIAPVIYYSALMRNTKKMQSKEDYEPNINALLRSTLECSLCKFDKYV